MNIHYALEEGLISLFAFEDHVTLVNLRLLPFRLVQMNSKVWLVSENQRIPLDKLQKWIIVAL